MPEKLVTVGAEYFIFLSQVFKSQKTVSNELLSPLTLNMSLFELFSDTLHLSTLGQCEVFCIICL